MAATKPVAIVLAPSRTAVSGISTHLNLLFGSPLAEEFALIHFQAGGEGCEESAAARWRRLLMSPLRLAACIRRSGARLVHINTAMNRRAFWRDMGYVLTARLCGAHVVLQVHGGELPQRFAATQHVPQRLLRSLLQLPDVVIVIAREQLEAYRKFVPEQALLALPNGIDLNPYRNGLRSPPDPQAPLRLIYLGRLDRQKGLDETLQGLALARAQGVAATLVIAGSGPDEAQLKELAARLELSDAVSFVGPVFDAEKRRHLDAADVLMLPSYTEGLPYALLESMAAGVPAVATPVGGIPDIVEDGVHGVFVPVRDAQAIGRALIRLGNDRSLVADMGSACRQRVARFYTVERLADDLGQLYRGVSAEQNP
jgi:glycosyltransferase involved in cell wall biosynthesis